MLGGAVYGESWVSVHPRHAGHHQHAARPALQQRKARLRHAQCAHQVHLTNGVYYFWIIHLLRHVINKCDQLFSPVIFVLFLFFAPETNDGGPVSPLLGFCSICSYR